MHGSVFTLLILASGLAPETSPRPGTPHAPQYETPAWQRPGRLSLRLVPAHPDRLLLRQDPSEPANANSDSDVNNCVVYRYQIGRATLERVSPAEWSDAAGAVSDCDAQQVQPSDPLRIDAKSSLLYHGKQPRPTAGRTALLLVVAPRRDRAAVLSADGPRSSSPMPAIAQAGASGVHYHQLFSLSDGAALGQPVILPLSSSETTLGACWSADGRWVVYFDVLFRRVSIVTTVTTAEGSAP